MIIFGIILTTIIIFYYFLGHIPGTRYYTRKRFINLSSHIKSETDCQRIMYEYHVLLGLKKELYHNYWLDVDNDYFLSYIYQDVVNFVQKKCSVALECKPLHFNDIKCNKEDLKTFEKYYMQNINDDQHQNIEFHDVEKNHPKFSLPCSINVYTDFNTNGYMFDINNVKKDGMCKREITGYIRK